jgi:hypothetical protein
MERIYQYELRNYDSRSLKIDRLPAVISQIEDLQHLRVRKGGKLREDPFEVCEKGGIVERPF